MCCFVYGCLSVVEYVRLLHLYVVVCGTQCVYSIASDSILWLNVCGCMCSCMWFYVWLCVIVVVCACMCGCEVRSVFSSCDCDHCLSAAVSILSRVVRVDAKESLAFRRL